MTDQRCVDFLQWALPELRMHWPGFRKVRGQVCKRLARRLQELEIRSFDAYRAHLAAHPDEWDRLDAMCRITISRFYRDRRVFDALRDDLLPELARRARDRGEEMLRGWSAGCASGEEVYTLTLLWRHVLQERFPTLTLHLTATDADAHMLKRARRGCYPPGTLKELPDAWIDEAFTHAGDAYCLRAAYRGGIDWRRQDVREEMPDGPFDLVLCRNLVFTYFTPLLQRACLSRMATRIRAGGVLVLGKHEMLPEAVPGFTDWYVRERIYRRTDPV